MTREEKLAEAARIRKEKEKALWADMPKMSKEELEPSREILDIVKEVEPMPDDVDIEKITPCGDKFLKPHKSSSSSISGV